MSVCITDFERKPSQLSICLSLRPQTAGEPSLGLRACPKLIQLNDSHCIKVHKFVCMNQVSTNQYIHVEIIVLTMLTYLPSFGLLFGIPFQDMLSPLWFNNIISHIIPYIYNIISHIIHYINNIISHIIHYICIIDCQMVYERYPSAWRIQILEVESL